MTGVPNLSRYATGLKDAFTLNFSIIKPVSTGTVYGTGPRVQNTFVPGYFQIQEFMPRGLPVFFFVCIRVCRSSILAK